LRAIWTLVVTIDASPDERRRRTVGVRMSAFPDGDGDERKWLRLQHR
jgi:hypothetical protein